MISTKRVYSFLFLSINFMLMTSCLDGIELDTGERVLNMYCVLEEGPIQELELSYIAPTGGTSSVVGEDVSITLYDEGSPVGLFTRTSETKWTLDYTPQGGHSYKLEVKVAGENTLSAETKYPSMGKLRTVYVEDYSLSEEYYSYGSDWIRKVYGGFELDTEEDLILWCYYENTSSGPAFVDYVATDHPGADARGETIYPMDRTSPIVYENFDHFYSGGQVFSQAFYGKPAFLHEKTIRIVHPADFSRPLDEKMNLIIYEHIDEVSGGPVPTMIETDRTSMFGIAGISNNGMVANLVFRAVSAEYDNYLVDHYYAHRNSGDFTEFVYQRNHYSNVLNGAGIFGASNEYRSGTYYFGIVPDL